MKQQSETTRKQTNRHRRRVFLKSSLLVGGVAVLPAAPAIAASPAAVAPVKRGYQETAHVRRYYDSVRHS